MNGKRRRRCASCDPAEPPCPPVQDEGGQSEGQEQGRGARAVQGGAGGNEWGGVTPWLILWSRQAALSSDAIYRRPI